MKLETDTLNHANILTNKGVPKEIAEAFVSAGAEIEIRNLYTKGEVNNMLNETTRELLSKFDDTKKEMSDTIIAFGKQNQSQMRWLIATIIAVGSVLASLHLLVH